MISHSFCMSLFGAALLLAHPLGAVAQTGVVVNGVVTNAADGGPLDQVSVVSGGQVVATTDAEGRFSTVPLTFSDGQLRLVWRRLGFRPHDELLRIGNQATSLTVNVTLEALPTVLQDIMVEGSRVQITNPGMVGFYNRRSDSLGRYLTQAEVQRRLADLTPHFARLRRGNPGAPCMAGDRNVVYLDGITFFDQGVLNRMIAPSQVEGIEYYTKEEFHRLPPELLPIGPVCTVTLLWTREVTGATTDVYRGFALGAFVGPSLKSSSTEFSAAGYMVVPLNFVPSLLGLRLTAATVARSDVKWRGTAAVAMRVYGSTKPIFVSGGIAVTKRDGGGPVERDPMFGVGYTTILGRLQPWIELQLIGGVPHSVVGFSFRFGSRESSDELTP